MHFVFHRPMYYYYYHLDMPESAQACMGQCYPGWRCRVDTFRCGVVIAVFKCEEDAFCFKEGVRSRQISWYHLNSAVQLSQGWHRVGGSPSLRKTRTRPEAWVQKHGPAVPIPKDYAVILQYSVPPFSPSPSTLYCTCWPSLWCISPDFQRFFSHPPSLSGRAVYWVFFLFSFFPVFIQVFTYSSPAPILGKVSNCKAAVELVTEHKKYACHDLWGGNVFYAWKELSGLRPFWLVRLFCGPR